MADADDLKALVWELLHHGFDVKIVVKDDGQVGFALLLDGWYTPGEAVTEEELQNVFAIWEGRHHRLLEAAGVELGNLEGDWSGTVAPRGDEPLAEQPGR